MAQGLHRVGLATHDIAAAGRFFGVHLGLGQAKRIDERTICFGEGSRGLRIHKPDAVLSRASGRLMAVAGARHAAIEVDDLEAVAGQLFKASLPVVEAAPGDFDADALYTLDPSLNLVAFVQSGRSEAAGVQPWERAWGWGLHHVNLPAGNVRETVAFYVEIAGMREGSWKASPARGDFSIDPSALAVIALDDFNRGLHVIRADAGFAIRNGFAHNPSIGGHPAFHVADVLAVKSRLEADGILVSDAGNYAMYGMHQIYVLDPAANMIEVNQFV